MDNLKLYLLRHGESQANVERIFAARKIDPPLSETGIRQATAQAEYLKDVRFSAIYSSPLLRAYHTAKIVAKHHKLEVNITECLYEADVGILDGESQKDPDKWAIFNDVIGKWDRGYADIRFPEGEALSDIGKRFGAFIDSLNDDVNKPILIVGHSLLFASALWLFCEGRGVGVMDNFMRSGHLSVVSKIGDRLYMMKFDTFPDETG